MKISTNSSLRAILLKVLIVSIPFEGITVIFPVLVLPLVILVLYLGLIFLSRDKYEDYRIDYRPLKILIALYGLIALVSFSNRTLYTGMGYSFLRQFPVYLIFFYVFSREFYRGVIDLKEVLQSFLFGVGIMLVLFFLNIDVERSESGRIAVAGIGSNTVSTYCNFALIFIISLLDKHEVGKRTRNVYLLMIPVILYLNLGTGSRGGFLGLLLGVFVYYFFRSTDFKKRFNYAATGIIAVAILSLVFLSNDLLYSRFFQENSSLTDSRLPLWMDAFSIVKDNLLFGVGLFSYQAEITSLRGMFFAVHNEYLSLLIYSGLVGLSLFLLFLYRGWQKAKRVSLFQGDPMFLSILVMLMLVLFKGGGALLTFITWFILALVHTSECFYEEEDA